MSGEVPEGWSTARLGEVSRTFAGGTPSRSNPAYYGTGIPWLKSGEVRTGRIDRTEEQITELGLGESSARVARAGTPVLAMYGGGTVGLAGILSIDAAINQAVLAIEPDRSRLDNEFCYYLLGAANRRLLSLIQGSGQANLSKAIVDELEVTLPPLDEQQRIAEVLRSVDQAIIASKAVERAVGVVFHRRREELIERAREASPEVFVADALRKNKGEKLKKLQTDQYASSGLHPIVDQGARFICGYTDDENALWPYDLPVIVFGDHTRILKFVDFPFAIGADGTQCLTPAAGIRPHYFYYALQSLDLPAEGYARHFKLLKEKTVPVPTPDDQAMIEDELAAIEATESEARQSVLKLEAVKIALSSDLLSGRVRVPA